MSFARDWTERRKEDIEIEKWDLGEGGRKGEEGRGGGSKSYGGGLS